MVSPGGLLLHLLSLKASFWEADASRRDRNMVVMSVPHGCREDEWVPPSLQFWREMGRGHLPNRLDPLA